MNKNNLDVKKIIALSVIVSLFFMWGMANNLNDILLKQFKKVFSLSDFQTGLVQSSFYLAYFFAAVPAALVMRRYKYKAGIITGLFLYAVGAALFYPAAEFQQYWIFLIALFVLASGLTFLETSANPIMALYGTPETAERRLNFAQAFNPLGSLTGVFIGRQFILSGIEYTPAQLMAMPAQKLKVYYATEAHAVEAPYLIIAAVVLLWAFFVSRIRIPSGKVAHDVSAPTGFALLLKQRRLLFGVLAQFCYVGAQVGIWSFTIRYSQHAVLGLPERAAADVLSYSLMAFLLGRFAGTAAMTRLPAPWVTGASAVLNCCLIAVVILVGGRVGIWMLIPLSFFMSTMYPTIFAMSIKRLGPLTQAGSSVLVMSIIGGAVFPLIMGRLSDLSNINWAFSAPALAFAVVAVFCLTDRSKLSYTSTVASPSHSLT
jgi:FHS family L-fucose permease-like MFS transporter